MLRKCAYPVLLLGVVLTWGVSRVGAAEIIWADPLPMDVPLLSGDVLEAINMGGPAVDNVGGVDFLAGDAAADPPQYSNFFDFLTSSWGGPTGAADFVTDPGLGTVVTTARWIGSTSTQDLQLINLTPGVTYRIQLYTGDQRSCCSDRWYHFEDDTGNVSPSWSRGGLMALIGEFTADSDTQQMSMIVESGSSDPHITGYVLSLATPPTLASQADPGPDANDIPRDADLSWKPGDYAVKHDVYFGTSFEDVNAASTADPLGVLVSQGQTENTFDPGRLDFDQVYYWRIDEVNGAPDNTVFKGDVWNFTAEPYSIPVEMVTATASSSNVGMGPENTVGGVGLNGLDQHSTEATEMWMSGMGDPAPWIQYEFDKPYKLNEMWVWNSNQLIESFVGLGAKDVVVEYSVDGVDWTVLEGATQFNQATGSPTYTANTMVDFGGALAQYVKITISAGYGMLPQYGISEVRFYYIPTFAREPMPADGDTTASANVELSWRAGREAASHEIHLGTDPNDLPLVATVADNSYLANGLLFDTAYYWQVVEVNDNETPTVYAGPVWGFNTPTHGTVDNMDGYDDKCNRIFFAWADGLGHSGGEDIENCDVPPSNGNGGGAIVGNDLAPFAEQTIVYAGKQSMPFNYDNAFGDSYATLTLDGQDWTASGIQTLSIMFYGTAGNTGQLYVKINNTKVSYADDAANIGRAEWQAWVIDLSTVGGNLQNVTSLTIGVDGANASGMLYFDEIGVYPKPAEYLTPVDPGTASLAGHWSFDEGSGTSAADSSGHGNNATLVNVGWQTGQMGSAVVFDGISAYADVPAAAWNSIEQQVTVTAWMYVDSSIAQTPFTMAAFQDPTDNESRVFSNHVVWSGTLYFDTGGNNPGGGTNYDRISRAATAADYGDAWIHWAFVKNAQTGEQKIYRNGILWQSGTGMTKPMTGVTVFHLGANAAAAGEFWNGSMDDLRLYNTELSQAEILWLAGRTSPVVKPF